MYSKINYVMTLCLIVGAFCFFSCSKSKPKEIKDVVLEKKESLVEKNEVEIIVLKKESFQKEIVSNGNLIAKQKNILKFEISERLEKLFVKNGDFVKKNQVIATLNPFKYKQRVDEAKLQLKKAKLEFEDMLIGREIFTTNKDSIPKDIYDMVASRSGYDIALLQLKTAEFELRSTKLLAPFSGKIANVRKKQYENIGAGDDFMTLINDKEFEVEFRLIESEINDVAVNDNIQILPFAIDNEIFKGKISSINPLVDENGTVLIKAQVKNDGRLSEGMNVKVKIQKEIENQFVVPKSAVVLRQNQEVLFKVKNRRAFWTYVKTTMENSTSYSLIANPNKSTAFLKIGDTIIVSGNLNLAHDSKIFIKDN